RAMRRCPGIERRPPLGTPLPEPPPVVSPGLRRPTRAEDSRWELIDWNRGTALRHPVCSLCGRQGLPVKSDDDVWRSKGRDSCHGMAVIWRSF
ncbi:MAG: hypothetical protein ACREXU_18325, partial [Gammaproteobacteria bacterium]